MAKVAIELKRALAERARHGTPGGTTPRVLASGTGWAVADVVCTAGPRDASFEEQHDHYAIAIVLAGTFQYHSPLGRAVLTPIFPRRRSSRTRRWPISPSCQAGHAYFPDQ